MKKLAFILLVIMSFVYGDDYKYVTNSEIGEKCYINMSPEYFTVYENGYKFWDKCTSKTKTSRTRITIDRETKHFCISAALSSNAKENVNVDTCPFRAWAEYGPDSIVAAYQRYLDKKYQNKSKTEAPKQEPTTHPYTFSG